MSSGYKNYSWCTHRKTSDHVIWSYYNNNCLHTEIWHQGRNEGPSMSCLCPCFYFTNWTSRAGIFPGLYVITHNEPARRIQSSDAWWRQHQHLCDSVLGSDSLKTTMAGDWSVADEVPSLRAFNDSGNCYQKYDGGEIEGTSSQCHTPTTAAFLSFTHRHHSDPIPPLSLPLKAENRQSHLDPPWRVCALHTTVKQNESATKPSM